MKQSETNAQAASRDAMRTGQLQANGLRFSYLEMGQGPLVLLLHGFPDTAHGWAEFMPVLARAGYRAVAPFTRGYAPTEVPATSATTTEELAADALALITALGHDKAILVGHDWGAATAYLAAATDPSRIEKLVAVAIPHPAALKPTPSLAWAARHFVSFRLPGAVSRAQRGDLKLIDELYRRWSPTWDFGPEETAPVKAAFADRASLDAAIGYYRGFKPGYVAPPLRAKIAVPTLAVAGLDDPAMGVEAYERARRKFSGRYEVATMRGGHFPHRESPAAFHEAVMAFLASD